MSERRLALAAAVLALVVAMAARGGTATVDVDVNRPGAAIPPSFFGLMTEEINHSYDGGLFAELVQNRTFQDPLPRARRGQPAADAPPSGVPHWSGALDANDRVELDRTDPVNPALPVSVKLTMTDGFAGVQNDGYWGIPVRPNTTYTASFYAQGGGGFAGPVTASIVLDDGPRDGNAQVAYASTPAVTGRWQKYTLTLRTGPAAPITSRAKFVVGANGTGTVRLSLVSLFPPTYMNAPGGLRPDLMKLMADLHPAFIRLPGGNYLEGDTFPTRFNWKQMIGPADTRPGHMGCWNYRSSDGFGLPQYLLWCKQLHAEPVLAVFAGYVLNHDVVAADSPEMAQYAQEAVEEIEYVSGPAESTWGRRRAADGFPEPFHLTYVEVGNEDWFDRKAGSYDARYTVMAHAIRARYPQLELIATAPVHSAKVDVYDDHYYRSVAAMAGDVAHYDGDHGGRLAFNNGHHDGAVPRDGQKIFVGEWATREGGVTSSLDAALADAVWLMGMERNADVIPIQCYAPLLVNVNPGAWQWKIDLIGYDAMTSFGSCSYHAQAMCAQNKGDRSLPTRVSVPPIMAATEPAPHGGVGVGTWHTTAEYRDLLVTAPDGQVLMTADPAATGDGATKGWTFTGDKWAMEHGALKPSAADTETWGITGDPKWTDYTLRLKARKTGGREGFLILVHAVDGENYVWWNVGGWGNARSQLDAHHEGSGHLLGRPVDFTVATGRWYELRVEVRRHHYACYADDRLIQEATDTPEQVRTPLFAGATYDSAAHQAIVKVVNLGNSPVEATVNLHGAGDVSATGTAIVLAGHPRDENTIDEPTKVVPRAEPLTDAGASFGRTFPPHSLTLLRVGATAK